MEHSLIDSLAHVAARYAGMINSGSVSDDELFRWETALHTIALLTRDTYDADFTLFLEGNDGSEFGKNVEEAISEILIQYNADYTTLQTVEEAAKMLDIILSEDDGQPSTSENSDAG